MAKKERGNAYWKTMVCIDRCIFGEMEGRLFNPHWPAAHPFHGTLSFLNEMEDLLCETQLPQAFTTMRRFQSAEVSDGPPGSEPFSAEPLRGTVATFSLQILFYQNTTWQGRVEWLEGKRSAAFRSALELLLLMDSVFRETQQAQTSEIL